MMNPADAKEMRPAKVLVMETSRVKVLVMATCAAVAVIVSTSLVRSQCTLRKTA